MDDRDMIVGNVYRKLMEIESRLLPCGLHVVGCPPTAEEAVATLVNIAELDRPDQTPMPIKGLPGILARSIGRDIESIYSGNNKGVLADVDQLQRITEACRSCVREFVKDRTGFNGRIGNNLITQLIKFTGFYVDPWVRALQGGEFASADREDLITLFNYLEFCLTQVGRKRTGFDGQDLSAMGLWGRARGGRGGSCVTPQLRPLCSMPLGR
jgi:magnesium chelatase subunit H